MNTLTVNAREHRGERSNTSRPTTVNIIMSLLTAMWPHAAWRLPTRCKLLLSKRPTRLSVYTCRQWVVLTLIHCQVLNLLPRLATLQNMVTILHQLVLILHSLQIYNVLPAVDPVYWYDAYHTYHIYITLNIMIFGCCNVNTAPVIKLNHLTSGNKPSTECEPHQWS